MRDSDATLLITRGAPTGGSAFTVEVATRLDKPVFHVDLNRESMDQVVPLVCRWLQDLHPAILNVAGSRASEDHEIYNLTKALLENAFLALNSRKNLRSDLPP